MTIALLRGSAASWVLVVLLVVVSGCRDASPKRPENVPPTAILAPGGKVGGWWQVCTVAEVEGSAHCRIWNAGGLLLYDEIFLPYDERPQVTKAELTIAPEPTFPGSDRIWLSNGRVLLPKSWFGDLKKFVDWLKSE